MPAPKSVEEAKSIVDDWITSSNQLARTDPKGAARNLYRKATTLEHMGEEHFPEGWMFAAQHIVEKLRRAARAIEGV